MCALGSLDVVFLVPASTDRINLARPLREFLTNTAESLRTTGALNTQVLFVKIKSHNRSGKCTTVFFPSPFLAFTYGLFFFFYLFQIGVVVYGSRPKIWFLLNRHARSDTLLQEIQSIPFDESPGSNIGWDFCLSPYLF